ncbi:peroxiredoxin [Sphingobium sp. OAS761]|uniref:peroxiredoxin n=1 Tax=Sphingobium sp. OAS761 TaxID=2817901 RepID=UPI00209E2987|nr:peroxiredoxin [Sphingobium sp. OAS761]MCP1471800.1 peroxiredoxin [Sphingobium sp. OAS761]
MKRLPLILAAAAVATFSSGGAMAALAVGAKAPDFTTRGAMAGKPFTLTLSHQLKRGPVVLYFFPKAFTPGCSAEAREFAENIDKFKAAGATVIGMSADPVDDLVSFSTKECAGKFPVASAGPGIVSGYDVALKMRPGMTDRTSYVIAPSGRIAFVHSEMNYAGHVKSTLEAVEAMKRK